MTALLFVIEGGQALAVVGLERFVVRGQRHTWSVQSSKGAGC